MRFSFVLMEMCVVIVVGSIDLWYLVDCLVNYF